MKKTKASQAAPKKLAAQIRPSPVKILISPAFQKAITKAIQLAEARVAHRDTCLSCGTPGALASMAKQGVRIGRICTTCWRPAFLSE